MLIPSDLMVLGTRYYHESGVPSCCALQHRKAYFVKSSIQGFSTAQQAWNSGFQKGFSVGRTEEGKNMQRVVSRHTALKFNQLLLVGLQPGHSVAQSYHHGGGGGLGFNRSFALQPMDSSVRSLIGHARVLGSLPGDNNNGGGSSRVGSSVPRVRPAITRRSFRESRKLVTRRSRQRSPSSSRIGSSRDFSPQRLLECAVDVLRNFNEKVNNLFQRGGGGGGEGGSRDFAPVAEKKVLTSADTAVRENGASELADASSEKPAGSEFKWRSAVWEAEVSSVQELDAVSQRGIRSLGTEAEISQSGGSDVPESALDGADVQIRVREKVEETMPEEITASPELQTPENGNGISTGPVNDTLSSAKIKVEISPVSDTPSSAKIEVEISPVSDTVSSAKIEVEILPMEESKTESRSGLVSLGADGNTSQLSRSTVPESALGEADVKFPADNKAEEDLSEVITAHRELEHSEIQNLTTEVQESDGLFSVEVDEEAEVSSVGSKSSDLIGLGTDGDIISQLSGSVVRESAVSEVDGEIRADKKIEAAAIEATTADRELKDLESENAVRTVSFIDGASFVEIDVAEGPSVEEPEAASTSGLKSLSSHGDISHVSGSDEPAGGLAAEADVAIRAMTEEPASDGELQHPESVLSTVQDSGEASSKDIVEVDISELWHRRTSGHSSLADLEPSISRELRPWGFGEDSVSAEAESLQPYIGERESDVEIESGDAKSSREELVEQNGRSEPLSEGSFATVEPEAVQSSELEIDTADSKLKLHEQADQGHYSEPASILEQQVENTSAPAHVDIFEKRSSPEIQDGIDTKSHLVEELAEQTPNSEPPPNVGREEAVNSFRNVDHELGESSEGPSIDKHALKTASLGNTKDEETSTLGGQAVTDEKSGETVDAIEKEILQNEGPIGALLANDPLPAGEASNMEMTPVSPDKDLLSEEFGELVRERDADDADIASQKQIPADPSRTGSDSSTDKTVGETKDVAIQQEISRLRSSISHHAYLYHTLDNPVISDAAYDSLVNELVNLQTQVSNSEPKLNVLVAAEPSPDVLKIVHSVPMLSLASVQKEEEASLWYQRLKLKLGSDHKPLRWVVEPKVDGLALSLRYEHGKLKWAATRGNGIQGEDVTHNAQRVLGIPLTIPDNLPGTESPLTVLEVRGEVYMSLKDFKDWNASKMQSGEKPMANPRNAAAGSMRLLSSNASECRPLNFMAYGIAVMEESTEENLEEESSWVPKTQWEVLQLLESAGFPVNDDNKLFESFESALEYANSWKGTRESLEYEADGVVLKVDDLETQTSLGSAGADPRWALAWKFAATEAVSLLEGIELTIGRSGAMIPNARFKPVELGGVTISRASLHNFGHVRSLGLCEGDRIVVQRAGDVIPQVVQVLEDLRPETAKPWSPPTECPTCGSKLTEISASAMVFCSNSTCESRHSRQVAHFAKTLISGLGSATLSRLEEDLVKDPADFYNLDAQALSKVKGFGKQSTKKLLKAIEESKQQDVWLFIAALGIPRVGANTAKDLAERFGSLQALLKSDLSGFKDVPGIGAGTASCIFDWCQSEPNIELVRRLEAAGCKVNGNPVMETNEKPDSEHDVLITDQSQTVAPGSIVDSEGEPDAVEDLKEEVIETNESGGTSNVRKESDEAPTPPVFSGKSVVITGDFGPTLREDMKKLVILHGGVVRTSVTSRTCILLCGNRPGPLKVAEASRRGIEMLDLPTFYRLIGQTE